MLTTSYEVDEGITVPYAPIFDQIRCNHGFVDTRGRPDIAASIPEASKSSALKRLLIQLASPNSSFFSLGCDLGAHEEKWCVETERYVAGGYVQIMFADYANRSSDDYYALATAVAREMDGRAQVHSWMLRFALGYVDFRLENAPDLIPSLWVWFYSRAFSSNVALVSREDLIRSLCDVLEVVSDRRSNLDN
jgi:hypothetical protein